MANALGNSGVTGILTALLVECWGESLKALGAREDGRCETGDK